MVFVNLLRCDTERPPDSLLGSKVDGFVLYTQHVNFRKVRVQGARFFAAVHERYGGRPMVFVNLLRCDTESGETGLSEVFQVRRFTSSFSSSLLSSQVLEGPGALI